MQPHCRPATTPAHAMTPMDRDLKIVRELFEPLERILFRAWQLHQLGHADHLTWESAPPAVRVLIHTAAGQALASVGEPVWVSSSRLALRACGRCGNPLLSPRERTSTHCDTCIQEFLVRR